MPNVTTASTMTQVDQKVLMRPVPFPARETGEAPVSGLTGASGGVSDGT